MVDKVVKTKYLMGIKKKLATETAQTAYFKARYYE